MEDNEVRIFGVCKNCGETITDEFEEYYVNEEGELFCCEECVCEAHGIEKVEV